ncbi:MAG: HAMP domain-containing sensor histidine kinase [Acutalibacteraceae bacterium]|nr:HAMP domain-containing sensor histidine kinase [Acutalibacteraceae bacterium]
MKKSNTQKKNRPAKSVAFTVFRNFTVRNIIFFGIILVSYLIIYLFAKQNPDFDLILGNTYNGFIAPLLLKFFNEQILNFFYNNHFYLCFVVFFWWFLVNCLFTSITTLSCFHKTCRSLEAFTDSEKEIASFSKEFSDIEIRLKDIKLDVLESRNRATEAENKKNDLVMYLAHDLKTPLTSVIGYLTLLDEAPELTYEQRAKFTGIALDKAFRLEQLITEFFEITRFNINTITLQKNRIDLNMMLCQIADEFYPMLAEKNIRIDIDIPEKILMLADSDKIARVFDNLLKNAVNYSYENSLIRIGARIRQNRIIIKFRNKCDEIPAEKLERLFEKFYRTDSSRNSASGGSGLGLAIAKQITELHGGTIKAKSSVDYTDFTVILPFINAAEITDEQLEF